MDKILNTVFETIGSTISYCLIFILDKIFEMAIYVSEHPTPQVIFYRVAGAMMLFAITTSLISIYINRRRRRLRQNKPREFNDKTGNTFIINGGNNQIGDNNTQNNSDRQKQ
nr:MAG TPA: chitin synthase regulator [Caudoviricetes sp.]